MVRALKFEGNRAIDDYTLRAFIATSASSWSASYWWIRWLGLGEKRPLDEDELRRDVVRLLLVYRQSGYLAARVDTVVRRDARSAFVTFVITEGPPVRVRHLTVTGVAGLLDTGRLRQDLPLEVGDPFNRFQFLAAADTIIRRLRRVGYPYADVLRSFDVLAESLRADVALEAVPGPRMRIGAVEITGLERIAEPTVRRVLSLRPGQLYGEHQLFRAQRDLYDLGVFRYADVALVDTAPPDDPTDSTVAIAVRVAEGKRRRVRIGIGFATEECFRGRAGLTFSDFLGGARSLDLDGRVAMLGVGVPGPQGLQDGLCTSLGNPADDFWTDTLTYAGGLTLRQPAFPGRRHLTTVGVFAERRAEPHAYVRQAVGGNLEVTLNARGIAPVSVAYGYSLGSTTAEPGVYCSLFQACTAADQAFLAQQRPFAGLTLSAVRRRVDAVLDPSAGSVASVRFTHSSSRVGSDPLFAFNRGEVSLARYHRLGRQRVLAWRIFAGAILPAIVRARSDTGRFVPPEHRFYAGGPTTVRGYGPNQLGPVVYVTRDTTRFDSTLAARGDTVYTDLRTAPTGGSSALVGNLELRLPSPILRRAMQLTLFVDVGQVWQHSTPYFALRDLRVTPGAGVRLTTPIGPVRIDAAYNGYGSPPGTLLFATDSSLTPIRSGYRVPRSGSFWERFQVQFAVGPTF